MSDAMECPDSPEELRKKLDLMLHEHVRVCREGHEGYVKGILAPGNSDVWEVNGPNGAYARFALRNITSICKAHIHIYIKPAEQ